MYCDPVANAEKLKVMLTQAVEAFHTQTPISWNVGQAGFSANYIRQLLTLALKDIIARDDILPELPRNNLSRMVALWSFRANGPFVEYRPKKKNYAVLESLLPSENSPPSTQDVRLEIDGTNFDIVSAAALLKNHDQIQHPFYLIHFNPEFLVRLTNLYPNIEIIQDEIAGQPSEHYILI